MRISKTDFEYFIYNNIKLIGKMCDNEYLSYISFHSYKDIIYVNIKYLDDSIGYHYLNITNLFNIESSFMANTHEEKISQNLKRYYNTFQLLE